MKTYKFDDLKAIGINPLTGEADAFGMRLLCDLSEKGADLVRRFLGLESGGSERHFQRNWNSMVGDDPAVAAVMLTRNTINDLMRFHAFAVENADAYVEGPYQITALNRDDEMYEAYEKLAAEGTSRCARMFVRNPAKTSSQPRVGDRNVHAATGRAE